MKPNYLIFSFFEITEHIALYKKQGDSVNWADILSLGERHPVTLIQIVDDSDSYIVLAYAEWGWDDKDRELKLGKIKVNDGKQGIGTTIMKMVIAIAKYYGAPRITGTVTGDKFLWNWYLKLGFTIVDDNKLLMEFHQDGISK